VIFSLGNRRIETEGDDYYIAPGACVIGSVRFGKGSSVWFNCVLRGDAEWIELGEGCNVQDGSVIHADEGEPSILGRNVSVGHCALVHSCIVGDSTLIASGARIFDGAQIGRNCVIAAGALVPPRKVIPDGSVVMGVPGKIVRQTNDGDLKMIATTAAHYRARIALYKTQLRVDERPDRSRR
jgi:carbonic anhydrase/acetyltransferase-like protein (isoleucine patch superfamily)